LNVVGWYNQNSGGLKEVGKKQANELGIFDMSGNLFEWSGSWYSGSEGSYRVIRGGDWNYGVAEDCTVASRNGSYPGNRGRFSGFRVALSSVP
jgi:formylglycine-generating enzyme required for sulfatase activity